MFHFTIYLLLRKPNRMLPATKDRRTAIISQGDMSVMVSIGHHLCTRQEDEVKQSA